MSRTSLRDARPRRRERPLPAASPAPRLKCPFFVKDVMQADVKTLNRNDSLDMAEALMILGSLRHLPILDDDGQVVGMISSKDIFRSALAFAMGYGEWGRRKLLRTILVKEVMSSPVITIGPGAPLADAAGRMLQHRIGCLPVVEEGRLLGIVSEADLLRSLIASMK
jgi:CBS domain-containing protein